MVKQSNKDSVDEIIKRTEGDSNLFFLNYEGLTVGKATALRATLKNNNAEMKIYKNTLVLIALKKTKQEKAEGLDKLLSGNTAIVFVEKGSVAQAKILVDFAKENEFIKIKGAFFENTVLDEKAVRELAKLPSKEVLLSSLLMLLNSPATGFANVLQGNIRQFVQVLSAVEKQKSV